MYILFVIIIFSFFIAILLCLGKKIPDSIKYDGLIVLFYKLSAVILDTRLYKKHCKSLEKQKKIALLFPAGNCEEQLRIFEIKKWSFSLLLLFIGAIVSLILSINVLLENPLKGNSLIRRNDYGKGSKSVTLDIYADGNLIIPEKNLEISERYYTNQEITNLFNTIIPELEKQILGRNKSFEYVIYDLSFPSMIDDFPFSIEYELNNYQVMNREGIIHTENLISSGTPLTITAKLKYKTYQNEHNINAIIYPKPKNSDENLYDLILNEIARYETASYEYEDCILPSVVDGKQISYVPTKKNNSWLILLLFITFSLVIFKAHDQDMDKNIKERDKQMMIDYPKIVSKMTLLLGAGMTIQGAFNKIASEYLSHKNKTGNRFAYEEMLITIREIKSGISETDAFIRFGNRCRLQKYIKLSVLLSQNLKKGSNGLLLSMEEEERIAFEERKSMARKLGEEAGTKLLVPMVMMLGIVMIIVIVPAFLSFSF